MSQKCCFLENIIRKIGVVKFCVYVKKLSSKLIFQFTADDVWRNTLHADKSLHQHTHACTKGKIDPQTIKKKMYHIYIHSKNILKWDALRSNAWDVRIKTFSNTFPSW